MGHITSSLEAENNLTVVTVTGKVDMKQVLGQIISFLSGGRLSLSRGILRKEVWQVFRVLICSCS